MSASNEFPPPILTNKAYEADSAFAPESLLREARRQKDLPPSRVPEVCLLDPDGDIVRRLRDSGRARRHEGWACYHTSLYVTDYEGLEIGIVDCAVGVPFAVLVAEELFASGCELLVSVTSAGQIADAQPPPYFILIDRALRDEGTSYHYLPPSDWSEAPGKVIEELARAFEGFHPPVKRGRPGPPTPRFEKRTRRSRRCGNTAPGGRDGSGGPIRFRTRKEPDGRLLRTRDEPDGTNRRRFRKGRGERNGPSIANRPPRGAADSRR